MLPRDQRVSRPRRGGGPVQYPGLVREGRQVRGQRDQLGVQGKCPIPGLGAGVIQYPGLVDLQVSRLI